MGCTHRLRIINGHPDASAERLCAALAKSYSDGATGAGHEVRLINVGELDFPIIRSAAQFESDDVPPTIVEAQETIRWADHLVLIYPLWLGMLPALLKAFLEQVFRYGFAVDAEPAGWTGKLKGKSARIIVTMGMPALFYRIYFWAHSLHALRRNILSFSGMSPVRTTVLGSVEAMSAERREKWLRDMADHGRRAR